jgi:serpin B
MKKLLFHVLTLTAAISLVLTSCGPVTRPSSAGGEAESSQERVKDPNVPAADQEELVWGDTAFAMDLYDQLRSTEGNLFYSPYSISLALAMTYAGARGQTADQMAAALHFNLPQDRLHPAFNALDQALAGGATSGAEEKFQLNVVNSLWGQKDWTFLQAYLDLLAENYGAGMRLMDYKSDPEKARQAINDWVAGQTKDKIKDLIPQGLIDPTTVLLLVNAIYFKADWQHQFDASMTAEDTFNRLDGSTLTTPMMRFDEPSFLKYGKGSGWQAVALPYSGGTTEMVILLPDGGNFGQFEQNLNAEKLDQILGSLEDQGVALTLPKFSFTGQFKLKQALATLGMPLAFDEDNADFSGMDGNHLLYIDDVVHKAFVAVDEKGTEAAAATGVVIRPASAMMESVRMQVDRPFLFLIRDAATGSILFMGRVVDPSK